MNELRGTKIKLRDFNLSTRITLSAVLLVFVSGLLWVVYQNKLQKQVHFHEQLEEANLALQRQSVDLERTIANLQQDVVFLARVPPISGMIRAKENSGFDPVDKNDYATWERRLQEIFTGFLEAHPEYAQARFISVADEGKVLVKVQYHEGQIEITPHQMLQGMSNSSFFKAGLTLHNGEVHLSEISLEKDGNHIEVPHRPTLRAVTPVFGSDGQVFGVVVINLDIQPLLKDSMASIPERFKGYIANQQGYYLFHPDSKREYEFEFGSKANISNDFPKLKSIFGTQTPSVVKLQPSGDKLNGYVAAKRIFFDTKDHAQFLVLAYYLSQQELKSPFVQLSLFELFKAILIATIFAGIFRFLLRRTFTPLKRITLAAQEIAAGNHSLRLTESGKNEIGQLSLALNNMLDELSDHERIKKENEFRRAITETAHDGYWLVDTQGYLLEVNQAYADTFGYTVDELVGMHVSQLEAKELSADEVNAHLKQIIEQGNDFFESQHRHKDGRILDVEVSTSFIPETKQAVAFIHNITRRKQAETALKDSEFRWKFAIEGAGDGVWDWNIQTDEVQYSKRWKEMLGYYDQDILPRNDEWSSRVHPDDQSYVNNTMQAYLQGKTEIYVVEYRLRCKDDSYKWILGRGMIVSRSEDGKPLRMIGTHTDITDRKEAEIMLSNKEEQLHFVLEASGLGFWDWHIPSGEVYRNHIWAEMLGYTYEEIKETTNQWADFVHPDDIENAWKSINDVLEGHTTVHELVYRMRTKSGEYKWILDRAKVVERDAEGKAVRMTGSHADYTERKQLELELTRQAHLDYLTGLYNRRHFMEQGEKELSRAIRYNTPLSVLMLDIDFFKNVNDTHGHQVGDIVLQELAKICRSTLRQVDIAGRLGGEEFAILLPEAEAKEALEVAERLRETVAKMDVVIPTGLPIHFTVSIGVTTLDKKNINLDILINQADKALYQAKETGRNRVCVG